MNLYIPDTTDSDEFNANSSSKKGTWISLLTYCLKRENSGVIRNCRSWSNREWIMNCKTCIKDVTKESNLFWFEGTDLFVFGYPLETEKRVISNRENGRKGGRPKELRGITKKPNENHVVSNGLTESITETKPCQNLIGIDIGMDIEKNISPSGESSSPAREVAGSADETRELPFAAEQPRRSSRQPEVQPLPRSADEVEAYFRNEIACGRLRLPLAKVRDAAERFFNQHEGAGWILNNGMSIAKWKPIASNYGSRYAENEPRFSGNNGAGEDPLASYNKLS